MIKYFRMKRNELKIKAALYEALADIINNNSEYLEFAKKLYFSLKDVPVDELKTEFIKELAGLIHEENVA